MNTEKNNLMAPRILWLFGTLLAVALAGTYLRAMPFLPSGGPEFAFVRHAHSHLAFLGWFVFGLRTVRAFTPAKRFGINQCPAKPLIPPEQKNST